MQQVTIQPTTPPGHRRTLPYRLDAQGSVVDQELWRGDPAALIGFQRESELKRIDLLFAEFWQEPEEAVGMFPIFVTAAGDIYLLQIEVDEVHRDDSDT